MNTINLFQAVESWGRDQSQMYPVVSSTQPKVVWFLPFFFPPSPDYLTLYNSLHAQFTLTDLSHSHMQGETLQIKHPAPKAWHLVMWE